MSTEGWRDRSHLPMPDPPLTGLVTFDAKDPDTKFPPIEELRPPKGAPNVMIILIDDVGFGASSAFGGPCHTPTFERLAAGGLKFNRFHTCALCSPTRQALLTGRNHHTVGMASITEFATSAPGYSSVRPKSCAPLAQTLRLNGYCTAQFGKCHEVPSWHVCPAGPFDNWPTSSGFDYFYGFICAETNQYFPALWECTTPVEPEKTPEEGYHLTEALTDKAIEWVRQQKALLPDKPFFMYFAPGATHAPHHVPKEWSGKYKGKFDKGWDKVREETFARQKKLGVIPPDCKLTKRHPEIPGWDDVDPAMKPVLARQMEVYAGFLEHTDHHVGRLIDALAEMEILHDTLIYLIIGDNGASAEGTLKGTLNEMLSIGGFGDLETPDFLRKNIDKFGGPDAYNHYAVGWAHAMDAPYQWTKQIASHWGGTRNGMIVHWPKGIKAKGEIRSQFHHVIDVAPTILEAAGLPEPAAVNGIAQKPYEGVSMKYSFEDARAAERRETQYFEMNGNRGIYHKGWTAVTKHRTPWLTGALKQIPFDDDVWELYDTNTDWTQAQDLAKEMPAKLHELQRLWLIEAVRHNVLPLDDRFIERANPELAGRPEMIHGNRQLLYPGMKRLSPYAIINTGNKSCAFTAEVVAPEKRAEGVILAYGGRMGGFSIYARAGKMKYCYNFFNMQYSFVESDRPIPSGKHQLRVEFAYDGGGLGKGGQITLYIDGAKVGQGRLERTAPFGFSADETLDVGMEAGSPVSPDYGPRGNAFNGKVNWVEIDADKAALDQDHILTAEERFRVAMALQ